MVAKVNVFADFGQETHIEDDWRLTNFGIETDLYPHKEGQSYLI